jgi:L-aminopeptidase/D-esterase-like protein
VNRSDAIRARLHAISLANAGLIAHHPTDLDALLAVATAAVDYVEAASTQENTPILHRLWDRLCDALNALADEAQR